MNHYHWLLLKLVGEPYEKIYTGDGQVVCEMSVLSTRHAKSRCFNIPINLYLRP